MLGKFVVFEAPPLEVLGVEEKPLTSGQYMEMLDRNSRLPGVLCHSIREVVDLVCPGRSTRRGLPGKEDAQ